MTKLLSPEEQKAPHPTDIFVGMKMRFRRKKLKITQTNLANALGLSFQQIQKYERGFNRISASRLYDIATVFGVPVSYFFEGLNGDIQYESKATSELVFMQSNIGSKLVTLLSRLNPRYLQPLSVHIASLVELQPFIKL